MREKNNNKTNKQNKKQTNKQKTKQKTHKKPRPTKNFLVYSQRQRTNSGLLLTNPTPQQLNKVRTKQKAHCLQNNKVRTKQKAHCLQNRLLIVQSLTRSKQQQLHKILKKLKPIARK